jgi:hypothetical protein
MVIVALPSAPAAERTAFKNSLSRLCQGSGQQICDQVGLASLNASGPAPYEPLIKAYP